MKLKFVVVLNSKIVKKILFAIWKLGFLSIFIIFNIKFLKVNLKYFFNYTVIRSFYPLSKPSSKFFIKIKTLQRIKFINQYLINGFALISTTRGIFTDIESLMLRLGGEPVAFIG
jgi:ribosomal protein S8